ncbi:MULTISPECIES: hypothetical protein [Sorangium]|uniref:Uncharacterized protein n=1 Tax=Sorangium cellulosum TaxID=56 RepID=A0A4P2QKH7_SORCE|nr:MULTISPECIES: hypothetical protein [Sorangium]AUX30494.1 uncharacterized protein SOCE836_026000 [Sorangium cellulosum]WCQ89888.1 hypothetical protein NQZ70_02586 [Sorangium sp. Soce836]
MMCPVCSGPQTFVNGHRMCASCGAVEETGKHRADSAPAEVQSEAKAAPGEQEIREPPQTVRDGRKGKGSEERARAPEAPAPEPAVEVQAFCAGLPPVLLDPEVAAVVAEVEQFGREVAPRVRELWTRVRTLWNR